MSITQTNLLPLVARELRDVAHLTFSLDDLRDFIGLGLAEIGMFAPTRFQEDITLTQDVGTYQIRATVLTEATPEIEVRRVEIWDKTVTPKVPVALLNPASNERVNSSTAGWEVWNGSLTLSLTVTAASGW